MISDQSLLLSTTVLNDTLRQILRCVYINTVAFLLCMCFVFALVQKNGIVRAPEVKPLINQSSINHQSINQSINTIDFLQGSVNKTPTYNLKLQFLYTYIGTYVA